MKYTHIVICCWGNKEFERTLKLKPEESAEAAAEACVRDCQHLRNEENPENPLLVTAKLFSYAGEYSGEKYWKQSRPASGERPKGPSYPLSRSLGASS